jgi:signal peptidase II
MVSTFTMITFISELLRMERFSTKIKPYLYARNKMNRFLNALSYYRIPILTILAVLFIDQFIKIYIKLNYTIGEVARASDWCVLHFTENPGMAFGFEFGGEHGKLLLSLFRIAACIGGVFYIRYMLKHKEHKGFVFAVSLILAGAMGNIFDSLFYGVFFGESTESQVAQFMPASGGYASFLHGHVVDMFYFPIYEGTIPDWFPIWKGEDFQFFRPIFNFADAAISGGVGVIILFHKTFGKKPEVTEVAKDLDEKVESVSENNLNTNRL